MRMVIRVAIIGLGIMGRRMLVHMQLHDHFSPLSLWDPDPAACDAARALAPEAEIMTSADAAIRNSDLVYLACPPAVRHDYAIAAAAAGKALFLEKPFGICIDASKALLDTLKSYDIPVAVNFTQAAGAALTDCQKARDNKAMGTLVGVDIIVTYAAWPREWQKQADWLRFSAEGGMTREVISHFLFFTERILGQLHLVWGRATYPDDPELCETAILARLETDDGKPVSIMATVGGAQPDRQELTVKGSKSSRRIVDFHKDSSSDGDSFIPLRPLPQDPRAVSLKAQLDDLLALVQGRKTRLATIDEAFRVQCLVEAILSRSGHG